MKALVRNTGETITEKMHIEGINWRTGAPLTNEAWCGGPYQLVDNYIEVDDEAIYDVAVYPEPEEEPEEVTVTEDTVIIDGKEYTKAELRALLGE